MSFNQFWLLEIEWFYKNQFFETEQILVTLSIKMQKKYSLFTVGS